MKKTKWLSLVLVAALLCAALLSGCSLLTAMGRRAADRNLVPPTPAETAEPTPIPTPKPTPEPTPEPVLEQAQEPEYDLGEQRDLAEEAFLAFLAQQTLGDTGMFSLPYSFGSLYGDGEIDSILPAEAKLQDAIYSAWMVDMEADDMPEMVVLRAQNEMDDWGTAFTALYAEVYEYIEGEARCMDVLPLGTGLLQGNALSPGITDVFMMQTRAGWYIGIQSYGIAAYYGDGCGEEVAIYDYDGASLRNVFETGYAGSDFVDYLDDRGSDLRYLDRMGVIDFNEAYDADHYGLYFGNHRIIIENESVMPMLSVERWDNYNGRNFIDIYLGADWQYDADRSIYDAVDESERKEQILVDDDSFMVADASGLSSYLGIGLRRGE